MIGRLAVAFRGGSVLQGVLVAASPIGPDVVLDLQRSVVGARVAETVLCKWYEWQMANGRRNVAWMKRYLGPPHM